MKVELTTKQDISGKNIKESFNIDVIDDMLVIRGETYQYVCVNFEEFSEVFQKVVEEETYKLLKTFMKENVKL